LRKPRTATNRPMEAVSPSLIDCGTERVTTSRRPKRVSRKKRTPTSRRSRGQSASQSLRYRQRDPYQHRAANARADDKRQVGVKRHQQRTDDEDQNGAGGGGAFVHPADRQQSRDDHQ
jgi:hypothetical protein